MDETLPGFVVLEQVGREKLQRNRSLKLRVSMARVICPVTGMGDVPWHLKQTSYSLTAVLRGAPEMLTPRTRASVLPMALEEVDGSWPSWTRRTQSRAICEVSNLTQSRVPQSWYRCE